MKNAFMIAATGSGCGKTTITCALLRAMQRRGLTLKSYKCGPDYIDPMFHKSVLGIASENLDLFFSSKDEIYSMFYREDDCDVQIVEGVMGLYDGMYAADNEGSSYDLACKLNLPVVLVVNAHGMGRSLLAVIRGFQSMDEEKRIKGVILNQISPMYFETIRRVIEEELDLLVVGYFPKMEDCSIESRYLGLKMPSEIEKLEADLSRAAEVIAETVDFDRLFQLSAIDGMNKALGPADGNKAAKVRIGVARDEAFCFFYEANLNLLKHLGAELVEFSPLRDPKLPEHLDGLLLGGGYPELHAKALSENQSMRTSIRQAIEKGLPSLAECGGFMYLHDSISAEGSKYPMVGAVEGHCEKQKKLVRFGYLVITEKEHRFLRGTDSGIKGHEFHYYDSSNNGADAISIKPGGRRSWEAAHIAENHWWGFAHLYYPSNPAFAESFINQCQKWRESHE